MFRFRNLKCKCDSSVEPIYHIEETVVDEEYSNGRTIKRCVFKKSLDSAYENAKKVPTYKEYTLENLIAAGVGLDPINVSNMLTPTDRATLDIVGQNISTEAFDRLQYEQLLDDKKEKETPKNDLTNETTQD